MYLKPELNNILKGIIAIISIILLIYEIRRNFEVLMKQLTYVLNFFKMN